MERNILPTIIPPITGLVDEAFPLVVALSHEQPWQWFFSNYVQVVFKNDDARGYNVRFYKTDHRGIMWDTLNPWIKYNIFSVRLLKTLGMGIIDFLKNAVDNGYYVTLFLDRFYIPGVRNYQTSHLTHEAMVFGYDGVSERIHLIEYKESYMTQFAIAYSEFLQAYEHCDLERYDEIHMLKFDEKRQYAFDPVNLSEQLKDYVYSRNTSERYRINSNPIYSPFVTFGMDIYKDLRFLLDTNHLKYDIRVFHSFWEQKKVMALRAKYIADNGFVEDFAQFCEPCSQIENRAYLLKSQFMRLCATKNAAVLKAVHSLLDEIEERERSVYGKMIEKIDEQIERNSIKPENTWIPSCVFREGTRILEPIEADRLEFEFDLAIGSDAVDGVIGYSDSSTRVIAYSSMCFLLRCNPQGIFEAMDADRFRASTQVRYVRNGSYHVCIHADFVEQTYSITVLDGENLCRVAEGFRFGFPVKPPAAIDKISLIIDNMSSFTVKNHRISLV